MNEFIFSFVADARGSYIENSVSGGVVDAHT